MKGLPMVDRRQLLSAAAAVSASGAFALPAQGAASGAVASLPARDNVLIRNAYVITMTGAPDLPGGDVLVENGAIADVGTGLSAPGATVIDGTGFILMPGLVDTHWHMWTTLLRNMSGNTPEHGYFPTTTAIGNVYTPRDMYYGTLLSAAEAVFSGITTVHDWCHNIITPQHAEEDIRALQEAGIRARFCYGPARRMPLTEAINTDDVERFHREWASFSNEGLLTLGLGWRGVQAPFRLPDGTFELRPLAEAVYRKEHEAAMKLGIPISVHLNSTTNDRNHLLAIDKLGLLVKDLQIIHGIFTSPEEMKLMAAKGAVVSVSPYSELRIGFGVTKILEYLDHGVTLGLSVDTTPLTGNCDMFGIMKIVQNIENGRAENEFKLPARRVVELATIEGARSLGLADRIGSIATGKRADLIMVSSRDINMGPFTDPYYMLVDSAQAWNVDTVMVDGRILKRSGKLVAIDTATLMTEATKASREVRDRAKWW
ncbi:MAG: amidohydrolase family protein [Bradyrhizobiaceae bacterium]|nr:amidohydrolase family protein [Bradyrhizobiaceae bacterium]